MECILSAKIKNALMMKRLIEFTAVVKIHAGLSRKINQPFASAVCN
jgi:hypothetical protein